MAFKLGNRIVRISTETRSAIKDKIREQVPFQVRKGIIDLTKEDMKKGKCKNVEQYVQLSIFNIKKHQMSANMIKQAGMTYDDVAKLIRATIKGE